ncbi:MAG: hypothetical protein ACRDRP_15165 [Pseudonocardiaceae bacterium]
MKSEHQSAEQVLDDLGGKVTQGLALMVARTRADLDVYRRTFPEWVADSTDRGLLNWCHDRAWVHAVRIFDGMSEVSFVDQPPTRELYVGTRYRLRVKKHDIEGGVSTFLTQGALDFLEQQPATLDGLEEIRLIAGYRWDPGLRELDEPAGAVTTPILPPTQPRAPELGMASDDERDEGAQDR